MVICENKSPHKSIALLFSRVPPFALCTLSLLREGAGGPPSLFGARSSPRSKRAIKAAVVPLESASPSPNHFFEGAPHLADGRVTSAERRLQRRVQRRARPHRLGDPERRQPRRLGGRFLRDEDAHAARRLGHGLVGGPDAGEGLGVNRRRQRRRLRFRSRWSQGGRTETEQNNNHFTNCIGNANTVALIHA
jgi:hypothetical protein